MSIIDKIKKLKWSYTEQQIEKCVLVHAVTITSFMSLMLRNLSIFIVLKHVFVETQSIERFIIYCDIIDIYLHSCF